MLLNGISARRDGASVIVLTDFLSDFAGTERYTTTLCDALAVCGVKVEVFAAEPTRDRTWRNLLAARDHGKRPGVRRGNH